MNVGAVSAKRFKHSKFKDLIGVTSGVLLCTAALGLVAAFGGIKSFNLAIFLSILPIFTTGLMRVLEGSSIWPSWRISSVFDFKKIESYTKEDILSISYLKEKEHLTDPELDLLAEITARQNVGLLFLKLVRKGESSFSSLERKSALVEQELEKCISLATRLVVKNDNTSSYNIIEGIERKVYETLKASKISLNVEEIAHNYNSQRDEVFLAVYRSLFKSINKFTQEDYHQLTVLMKASKDSDRIFDDLDSLGSSFDWLEFKKSALMWHAEEHHMQKINNRINQVENTVLIKNSIAEAIEKNRQKANQTSPSSLTSVAPSININYKSTSLGDKWSEFNSIYSKILTQVYEQKLSDDLEYKKFCIFVENSIPQLQNFERQTQLISNEQQKSKLMQDIELMLSDCIGKAHNYSLSLEQSLSRQVRAHKLYMSATK